MGKVPREVLLASFAFYWYEVYGLPKEIIFEKFQEKQKNLFGRLSLLKLAFDHYQKKHNVPNAPKMSSKEFEKKFNAAVPKKRREEIAKQFNKEWKEHEKDNQS